ncbi:MAG: TonB-dependent receptor [Methylophaga sp.]|nr:TonB-dependent receptor [Methylophaga sp.]
MRLLKIYPIILSYACLSLPAYAEHVVLPGITVETTASKASPLWQTAVPGSVADSAEQLKKLPGANINRNGPLTSIAQYRGMFGDRFNVLVDGIRISQAGPNSMDSPLSYIAASQLDSLTLHRGIAPVSSGIETIGGSILANSKQSAFSQGDDFQISGEAGAGYTHNNDSHQLGLNTDISNQNHRLSLHASRDQGDVQRFDGGNILPSQHERDSFGGGYAYQNNDGLMASFDIEHHDTGVTGTSALPMDILFVRGERYKTLLRQTLNNGDMLSLRLNYQNTDHLMNNFSLRQGPAAAMQRQTYTDVFAYGAQLHSQHQNWLCGLETDMAEHNATLFNPNNSGFRLTNFNQVERDRYSVFAEWEGDLNADWSLQAGGRYSKIKNNADAVSAASLMGSMADMMQMRANTFNAEDRRQQDDLFDAAVTLNRVLRADLDLIVGAARKQRAASYQERYLWFPAESTSGLADGNN